MKNKIFLFLVLFVAINLFSNAYADDVLPAGTIKKGSLCNEKLIMDAKMGIAAKVAILGCKVLKNFDPFIVSMPEGTPGSRSWHEKWIVNGCGSQYPVNIRFAEDGATSAYWTIEK